MSCNILDYGPLAELTAIFVSSYLVAGWKTGSGQSKVAPTAVAQENHSLRPAFLGSAVGVLGLNADDFAAKSIQIEFARTTGAPADDDSYTAQ
jgi:hypothetical protein